MSSIFILDSPRKKANRRKRVKESDVNGGASTSGSGNKEPVSKKRKSDQQDELNTSIRQQNEEFHELRKQIDEYLSKECQKQILKHNHQFVPRDQKEVHIWEKKRKTFFVYNFFLNKKKYFIAALGSHYGYDLFWCDQAV